MSESVKFGLPFVDPAQAQKHLPVNESLSRLDAMAQLRLDGLGLVVPPLDAVDGQMFALGAGPVNDWEGQGGRLALRDNGGWLFATPQPGWTGWSVADGRAVTWDGAAWTVPPVASDPSGARMQAEVMLHEVTVPAGGALDSAAVIPAMCVVIGVTGRVVSALGTGTWALGVAGAVDRYGAGLGMAAGSWAHGLTGAPQAYYADTPLRLSPDPAFDGGTLRLAIHLMRLTPPDAV